MNRTTMGILICALTLATPTPAQEPPSAAPTPAQADPVQDLVAGMRAAEQRLSSVRAVLVTAGRLPGGVEVKTRGELRVLRGTQPGAAPSLFTRVDYAFGDGLEGRVECARTAAGIDMYEEDPAFGAVFLRIEPAVVLDLEWAGRTLEQSDLPGMVDPRAESPLGSGMIDDLARTFDLAVLDRRDRDGEPGTWIEGKRKAGLDEQDPDLPLAERVELFVRERDRALLLARWHVGQSVVQEVLVEELSVGVEFDAGAFVVDGRGLRQRDVRGYAAMWEQIQQVLDRAEARAKDGEKRPSKR